MICLIRPPLCSFLKLVFIFQLQVLDQNKAKTQESAILSTTKQHLTRVKKLLRPSAGGVQKLTAWSTTRWLGAEKWANYLAAGWLCPTNPASETGKKSRFIASGGGGRRSRRRRTRWGLIKPETICRQADKFMAPIISNEQSIADTPWIEQMHHLTSISQSSREENHCICVVLLMKRLVVLLCHKYGNYILGTLK